MVLRTALLGTTMLLTATLYTGGLKAQGEAPAGVTALISIQVESDDTGDPSAKLARLSRVVARHRGKILGGYVPTNSLIGSHSGTLLLLIELPTEASANALLANRNYQREGSTVLMVLGETVVIAQHRPPPGVWETQQAASSGVYLVAASALAPGGSFAECRDQVQTVLDLANRYHGRLLGSYRVTRVLVGEYKPALFMIVVWPDKARFQDFSHRLLTPRLSDRLLRQPAHGLSPGEMLLLESARVK